MNREGCTDARMHAQVDEWISGGWVGGQEMAEGWDQYINQGADSRRREACWVRDDCLPGSEMTNSGDREYNKLRVLKPYFPCLVQHLSKHLSQVCYWTSI